MTKIVLASSNPGKLAEFNHMFKQVNLEFVPQSQFAIQDADETAITFLENALIKARHAAKYSGLPALADDSGLCVPALGGAPGVYSARYAGEPRNDDANNQKLLQVMQGMSGKDRQAYFCCTLVYVTHEDDPMPLVFQGQWWGEIAYETRGVDGFGYNPVFLLPEVGKTVAELSMAEKNRLSHRGIATAKMLQYWQEQ